MVKNRARWNVRRRQFQKVFHIDIEDGLEMSDLEDEDQYLFMLEDQLDDPNEFEAYYQEVENETDQLEAEVEEQYDEDLWKTEEYWNQRKAEYEDDSKN
jgi:transcription termination factor NusB